MTNQGAQALFKQAYREARANGRIGYQKLNSPRVRMAAAQVLRNRLTSDETARCRQRYAELESELYWKNN